MNSLMISLLIFLQNHACRDIKMSTVYNGQNDFPLRILFGIQVLQVLSRRHVFIQSEDLCDMTVGVIDTPAGQQICR